MERQDEKIAYLIALPAIILAIALKIVPLLDAFKLPFIDYKPALGLGGSPYIGFRNFSSLFSTYYFRRLVSNTLMLKFGFVFISGVVALILGLSLSYIKRGWLRTIFIILSTIPYFIPASVYSYILLGTISTQYFLDPERFRISYIMLEVLRSSGILSIIVFSFIETRRRYGNTNLVSAVRAITILLLIQLSSLMTTDFEMLNEFLNPLVYNVADTIDTYMFRAGLLNGKVNQVSPMWLIRFIIQLFITIGVYYTIKNTYSEERAEEQEFEESPKRTLSEEKSYPRILSIVIYCIYIVVLCLPLISILISKGELIASTGSDKFKNVEILPIFIKYISITLVSVILNLFITILLAYPLTISHSRGKIAYEVLLLILLVSGQGGVHEFLYYRDIGMLSTVYPYILDGFFSIMNVLVLAGLYNSEYSFSKFSDYFTKLRRPAVALAGLRFIAMWNSYYLFQMPYVQNADMYSPITLFKTMVANAAGELNRPLMLMGLLVSLPPLIIGILLCIFADKRTFISYIRD